MNTITVIETTQTLGSYDDLGSATAAHLRLIEAAGVVNVDPEATPPGVEIEILGMTPTSVRLRTKIDGVHCKIKQ
jgi:hypothetical protein